MDFDRAIVTKSPDGTKKLGQTLSDILVTKQGKGELSGPVVICLYGLLGSGKTTFVQGLLQGLGISTRILSPTFIIVRRYKSPILPRAISHIDCYRLMHEKEAEDLGFREDFSDPSGLMLIEWADRLGTLIPEKRMDIYFEVHPEGHIIRITKDSYGCTR